MYVCIWNSRKQKTKFAAINKCCCDELQVATWPFVSNFQVHPVESTLHYGHK